MKTLALILLLTLSAVVEAQDSTSYTGTLSFRHFDWTPRFVFTDRDSIVVIAAGDTVRTRGNAYLIGFQMLLLKEWDAYKAECYADSSVMDTQYGRFIDIAGRRRWITPRFRYEHRGPTLSGFMEYIRKGK